MPLVNKSINISAPASKVFSFVTEPENWTRYISSLVAVKDCSADLPKKDGTFLWEYKMLGFKFSGKGLVTEHVKNKRFGLHLSGRATIKESYEFIDNGDKTTTLKIQIDYEIPAKAAEYFMGTKLGEKLNGMESKHVLDNIKTMCEA